MASNQVILVLLYGEIWKSLSTATPQSIAMNKRNPYAGIRGLKEDKAPLYRLQATGLGLHKSGRALTVTPPPQFPTAEAEPSEGSWIAALIIGIILVSMIVAIIVILLWKCCRRPVLADSHWAGRSPFADGDVPDVFMDSNQATKRSSTLFMLPWKWKQDTCLQHDPSAPEKPSPCPAGTETSPVPPAGPCSAASPAAAHAEASPPPAMEAAACAQASCPLPAAPPEGPDLPPPPDWLGEPTGDPSGDLGESQEPLSEAEEQLPPPPPELLAQEIHEPRPQPEHPV